MICQQKYPNIFRCGSHIQPIRRPEHARCLVAVDHFVHIAHAVKCRAIQSAFVRAFDEQPQAVALRGCVFFELQFARFGRRERKSSRFARQIQQVGNVAKTDMLQDIDGRLIGLGQQGLGQIGRCVIQVADDRFCQRYSGSFVLARHELRRPEDGNVPGLALAPRRASDFVAAPRNK
jgi:hypothetical protein